MINSATLVAGTPLVINTQAWGVVRLQLAGLSADSVAVSVSIDGTNYVTPQMTAANATTSTSGALANGIQQVLFGGSCYVKVARTGSADTLTFTYLLTN